MWTCPLCNQQFVKNNQSHSCRDKTIADFLRGKPAYPVSLFWAFVDHYRQIGGITVHATKSMVAVAARTRIAYIIKVGRDFVDIVFPFTQPYQDNLCFHKIAQVPNTRQFNHHFRMCSEEDLNDEVRRFMKLAYEEGS